jgi:hypothetical protein
MTEASETKGARTANLLISGWLFLSGFLWPHTDLSRLDTWAVGALGALFAALAITEDWARRVNTVLSAWLFASVFVIPDMNAGTRWHNAVVALVMLTLSLVPSGARVSLERERGV